MIQRPRLLPCLAVLLCVPLALAGCHKKSDDKAANAGGQILTRSVGDDMLPYDTVRSQPPLVSPDKASGDTPGKAGGAKSGAGPAGAKAVAGQADEAAAAAGDSAGGDSAPAEVKPTGE